jgi:hypothetical protein
VRFSRLPAAAVALVCAAAAAGCGLGPGGDSGTGELRVTRDYGRSAVIDPVGFEAKESDTVLRVLDSNADLTTRYGGAFVQGIDGVDGTTRDGRRYDWFFYVNGVESPVGSADVPLRDGDRVWWDYRDWSTAMRVPAVVGSFPKPFLHGFEGRAYGTRIDCLGATAPCTTARESLAGDGVRSGVFAGEHAPGFDAESAPTLRVIVGPWGAVRADRAAALIEKGPSQSGVFARFDGNELVALDERGAVSARFGPGAGLIAAVRLEDGPPTWVVTGSDRAGVEAAAALFDASDLRDHYAVVAPPGAAPLPVPVATMP